MSWVGVGQILNLIVGLATLKVWASYLSPADLGLMGLIIGLASTLVGIVVGPITQAVLVGHAAHVLRGNGCEFRSVAGRIIATHVFRSSAAIALLGLPVASIFDLHWMTPVAFISLFAIDAWRNFEQTLLTAARRQQEVAMITVGDAAFRLTFVWLFLAFFEADAYSAIGGNLVGAATLILLMRLVLRLEASPTLEPAPDLRHSMREELLELARPLVPSAMLANLTEMASRYIIGATIGLQAAGIFIVSYGLVKRPYGMLNNVISMAMTPLLSEVTARADMPARKQIRWRWMALSVCTSAAGIAFFYLLRDPILTIFLSEEYAAAADIVVGLALAIAISNVCSTINGFLIVESRAYAVLVNNSVGAFATVMLTFVLCYSLGVIGAVWALGAGFVLQLVVSAIAMRK